MPLSTFFTLREWCIEHDYLQPTRHISVEEQIAQDSWRERIESNGTGTFSAERFDNQPWVCLHVSNGSLALAPSTTRLELLVVVVDVASFRSLGVENVVKYAWHIRYRTRPIYRQKCQPAKFPAGNHKRGEATRSHHKSSDTLAAVVTNFFSCTP